MSDRQDQRLRNMGWAILAGSLVCLVANICLVVYLKIRQPDLGSQTASVKIDQDVIEELKQGTGLEASLLIDSILSIVQGYYVDDERVAVHKLLDQTLSSLKQHPKISVRQQGDKVFVRAGDETLRMVRNASSTYRETLINFIKLAGLVQRQVFKDGSAHDQDQWFERADVMVVNGLLSSLDAHSSLLSPDAYRELRQGTEGSFGGLGVLVGIREQLLTVIKPLPRSPALRAGIRNSDRILNIDGKHTYGLTLDDLVEHMRGEPGTLVDLVLLRDGVPSPVTVSLRREVITVDSVEPKVQRFKGHDFLSLKVENFAARTSEEIRSALANHRRMNQGINGVILDLRSNPGGLLDQAVAVADLFLDNGVIVTTKGRRFDVENASEGAENDFPMIVLLNEDSASASEIVAGALQDHERALVVGQPSFGKGSVQTIFELPGERALKLTIARYYTPLGRSIQNVGIYPDVWLQPVYKNEQNKNLLGNYRYKNERFLRNRLEAVKTRPNGFVGNSYTRFKSYLLAEKDERRNGVEPSEEDMEMNLALGIMDSVRRLQKNNWAEGGQRSSHWLALASPELKKKMKAIDEQTGNWLTKQHGIEWNKGELGHVDQQKLAMSVDYHGAKSIELGSEISIPFTIKNLDQYPVGRVSVFLNSPNAGLETTEVLVGKIEPDETRQGSVNVRIPTYLVQSHINLRIGLAIDSVPLLNQGDDRSFVLIPKVSADIDAYVSLADETGGKRPGTLEPKESARLRVMLINRSDKEAKDVKATLLNLSGSQVSIRNLDGNVMSIKSGEKRSLYVEITASERIYTNELELGLSIESKDLNEPIRRSITLSSAPNESVSTLGH